MATTLHPLGNDGGVNANQSLYPRTVAPRVDLEENRYPSPKFHPSTVWYSEPLRQQTPGSSFTDQPRQRFQEQQRNGLPYAQPQAAPHRLVVEHYSLDDGNMNESNNKPRALSTTSQEIKSTPLDLNGRSRTVNQGPRTQDTASQDTPAIRPSSPRRPAAISAVIVEPLRLDTFPPIIPLSASPAYSPPIAPKHRAQPQQPTFIIPPATPNPMNTVLSPVPPQQEEVCMECAMRDRDMAEVDVTSPGVWDRESDVLYDELKRREEEEEARGTPNADHSRPRARGARLSEQNLKLWLSLSPREPTSKQQTLKTYLKSQRALLEAEALAHAQAVQEAKQLDSKMRDTYSQLRRSVYDLTNGNSGGDDTGGLRIRPPLSPISGMMSPRHARSHSREITLLENGMIVEHVDVRKEEREERERRKKEEKRARKLSRSSALDVTSVISGPSNGQHTDGGLGLKPYSRYSQSNSIRPNSVLSIPSERPDIPTAYSQISFSDVHSVGSNSPGRPKFFGFRSLNAGWRSRDSLAPSGVSGSMIDMHLALQHEHDVYSTQAGELSTPRRSQIWQTTDPKLTNASEKQEKKRNGLTRIWRLVTGSARSDLPESRDVTRSVDRLEDDLPLAPPPPLSYLVDRRNGDLFMSNGRHSSTPSLPTTTSNKIAGPLPGMSPPTPPSSTLPSPISSRPYGVDVDHVEVRVNHGVNFDDQDVQRHDETPPKDKPFGIRKVHPTASEPDIRGQVANDFVPPVPQLPSIAPPLLLREKSLPPLPGEAIMTRNLIAVTEARPRTMHSDARPVGFGFPSLNAPIRSIDARRQSFGGMSSRPNLHSIPMKSQESGFFGLRYDEFGLSRRSLGPLEYAEKHPLQTAPLPTPARRRNKFLSTLFGKKQIRDLQLHSHPLQDNNVDPFQQFPPMRRSGSGGQEEPGLNGYATSNSRHSALSMGGAYPHARVSLTSRRAFEELVSQDPDFVAYRYPSNDQHLDLLR